MISLRRQALILIILPLTGCTPPSALDADGPLVSGGIRYQETSGRTVGGSSLWWRSFSDSGLNRDMQTALQGNLAQQQLGARIKQASASLRAERAALFPQVDLSTSASYDTERPGSTENAASFGGLFSWEIDVFGRIRSGVTASQREYNATIQDWLGGRLMLSAAVAETRFLVLEQRATLKVLRKQIETNKTLLELVQLRVGQGLASRVDLLQQERQLDATKTLVPPAEAELAAAEYALDVLTGRAPGGRTRDTRSTLPALPSTPGTGVPSDLLKNRPDLLAQWNRILALDAKTGQALADRLPRFIIGASRSASSIDSVRSIISSIIAEATVPITDGGARRAEVARSKAELRAALLEYSNSYLEAIRDVETALVRERKQSERLRLTNRQLDTARKALEETRIRYSQGLSDYLPVIDALTSVQTLELSVLTLQRQSLTLRVALHRALGGPMPKVQVP
ncbi:transporter [Oceaniferula spumae]|uniref:Transporter n=1 Tax=Oceaniferula spumae TaxID=2979115 RepID=A0AAT9FKA8_9BACT